MAETSLETLQLLDWRLRRLEHFLAPDAGDHADTSTRSSADAPTQDAVVTRMQRLEANLSEILSQHAAAGTLIGLEANHPQLFNWGAADEDIDDSDERNANKLQVVLASAPEFTEMASRLMTLHENSLPEPEELSTLLCLQARLASFEATQDMQLHDIAKLRGRTIEILQQWHEEHVLSSGERWASCEERLAQAETTVLRKETAKSRKESEA